MSKVARDFACPRCAAQPGQECVTGRPRRPRRPTPSHKERVALAAAHNTLTRRAAS